MEEFHKSHKEEAFGWVLALQGLIARLRCRAKAPATTGAARATRVAGARYLTLR